jgi:hypothetical protein
MPLPFPSTSCELEEGTEKITSREQSPIFGTVDRSFGAIVMVTYVSGEAKQLMLFAA